RRPHRSGGHRLGRLRLPRDLRDRPRRSHSLPPCRRHPAGGPREAHPSAAAGAEPMIESDRRGLTPSVLRRRVIACLISAMLSVAAAPGLAVEPGEMLADPALEARARAISSELRCLVCQNQSIDDSNADLA